MTDPYGVLGVSASATDEEIAKAYKTLAKRYHPDLNPGDAAAARRMGQINQAYDEIKTMRQSGNRQNTRPTGAGTAYSDPYDVYQEIFRRYGARTYTYTAEDYEQYRQSQRRSSPFRFAMAIFLAFLLFRFFAILMAGTTPVQRFLYGSGEPAYSYTQTYGYESP